jgi:hypothetical protein
VPVAIPIAAARPGACVIPVAAASRESPHAGGRILSHRQAVGARPHVLPGRAGHPGGTKGRVKGARADLPASLRRTSSARHTSPARLNPPAAPRGCLISPSRLYGRQLALTRGQPDLKGGRAGMHQNRVTARRRGSTAAACGGMPGACGGACGPVGE